MFQMAKWEIIGNVGKVEIVTGEKKVARVSIAYNERWTDGQGEKKERTHWFNAVAFAPKLVEAIDKNVKKGAYVRLAGTLKTSKYGPDNEPKYSTDLVITGVGYLSPKADGQGAGEDPEGE